MIDILEGLWEVVCAIFTGLFIVLQGLFYMLPLFINIAWTLFCIVAAIYLIPILLSGLVVGGIWVGLFWIFIVPFFKLIK